MSLFRWKPENSVEEADVRSLRDIERVERDLSKFLFAGLLTFLGFLPYILGISFAVTTHAVLPLLLAGILGGMIAAPQLASLTDTVLRSIRDDVGIWWHLYRRAWKRNAAASLLPGAFFGLIFATQVFAVTHVEMLEYSGFQLITLCLTMMLLFCIMAYFVPMLVTVELSFSAMLKNSLLLALQNLPKSLLAGLILFLFAGGVLLWFPVSTVVLLVGTFWVPVFLCCRIVYPILDKAFSLTQALSERREDK